jgi:glucose-6-phosphate 1-dehydrogenase
VNPIKCEEVVLGQYDGYKDDHTVPDDSNTPTFASVVLRVHNERWEGISFIHMYTVAKDATEILVLLFMV